MTVQPGLFRRSGQKSPKTGFLMTQLICFNYIAVIHSVMSGYDTTLLNTTPSIEHLPIEILQHIFLYLDAKSLSSCCLSCHRWRELIGESECIWRLQCLSLKDSIKHIKKDRKKGYSWKVCVSKMSRIMRKPAFCICQNKGAYQP